MYEGTIVEKVHPLPVGHNILCLGIKTTLAYWLDEVVGALPSGKGRRARLVILQPEPLLWSTEPVVFSGEYVETNRKFTILKAVRVEVHGILIGDAN